MDIKVLLDIKVPYLSSLMVDPGIKIQNSDIILATKRIQLNKVDFRRVHFVFSLINMSRRETELKKLQSLIGENE